MFERLDTPPEGYDRQLGSALTRAEKAALERVRGAAVQVAAVSPQHAA